MAHEQWLAISDDDVGAGSSTGRTDDDFEEQSDVVKELLRTRALVLSINDRLQSLVEFTSPDGPLAKSQQSAIRALSGWDALFQCAAQTTRQSTTAPS